MWEKGFCQETCPIQLIIGVACFWFVK